MKKLFSKEVSLMRVTSLKGGKTPSAKPGDDPVEVDERIQMYGEGGIQAHDPIKNKALSFFSELGYQWTRG